jgi:uncharacterized membrane protein
MNKILTANALLIFLMIAFSAISYQLLPDEIATHWNSLGQPDGFSEKTIGLAIMPLLVFVVSIVLSVIPRIDPLKKNILETAKEYYLFILLFSAFFFLIHSFIILSGFGMQADIRIMIMPGIAVLIGYSGFLMSKMKRNYFIGVRTPWTLASDTVWKKTHKLTAKLLYGYAVILLFSFLAPELFLFIVLLPALAISSITVVYSFHEYSREEKEGILA